MSRALVLTVGTGTRPDSDIVQPLKKSVRNANPERVVFLVTSESEGFARRIRDGLRSSVGDATLINLTNPDDIEQTFREALAALRSLRDEGYPPEDVEADYTSGTKAMTAGLVLAAVAFGCASLRYITGRREQGVVVAGSERFLSIPPVEVAAQRSIQTGMEFLRRFQYASVKEVLPRDAARLLSEYDARLCAGLAHLADAYEAWDRFQHGRFNPPYREVDFSIAELQRFQLPDGIAERVQGMHDARTSRRWQERWSLDHLADLWNNARRRIDEGRHDDAVARLYRLAEMLAQYELAHTFNVDTADVEPSKLPPGFDATALVSSRRREDKIKLDLNLDYQVLHAFGSRLGDAFAAAKDLPQLLSLRNTSILAHGVTPVRPSDADRLAAAVHALALMVDPDFGRRWAELRFPWQ